MADIIEITFEVVEKRDQPRLYRVVSRQGQTGENAERFILWEGTDAVYAQTVMRQSCHAAVDRRTEKISRPDVDNL